MGPTTPTELPDFLESELLRIVDTADDDADLAPAIDRLIAAHPDQSMAIRSWMQAHRRQTGGGYGGFRIVGELGRGGMGVVYEAEEPGTGRRVAVKVVRTAQAFSPEGVERFRREARLAASIVHPRCVLVLTADLAGSEPFIVMEKTSGRNLQDVVDAGGAMPIDRALAAILDAADGLQAAHDLGVLHRDVKPSNLFVEADGRVKVGDFGLSRSLHGELDLTQTGDVLGTPLYAAPEQLRGQRVDARADTYGLSATLFFLLTGRPPFGGKGIATLARILDEPAPRLRTLRADAPKELEKIVARGLAKDPGARWPTVASMREALAAIGRTTLVPPTASRRSTALLIDWGIVVAPVWTVALWADAFLSVPAILAEMVALIALAAFCESRVGATPGKALLRLSVRDVKSGGLPSLARAAARAAALVVPAYLPLLPTHDAIQAGLLQLTFRNEPWGLVTGLIATLWMVAIAWSIARRSDRRGLHELLSGTRTIQFRLLATAMPAHASRPSPLVGTESTPLGPYRWVGPIPASDVTRLARGEDPALGRTVLLLIEGMSFPSTVDAARRALSRPARLRWLSSGTTDGGRAWHAFADPGSASVLHADAADRAVPLLRELAHELHDAAADGTLPTFLRDTQIHARADGGVLLLDWPLDEPLEPATWTSSETDAISLIRPLARRLSTLWSPLAIPRSATQAIARPSLAAIAAGLDACGDDNARVSATARHVYWGVQATWSSLALAFAILLVIVSSMASAFVAADVDLAGLRAAQELLENGDRWPAVEAYFAERDAAGKPKGDAMYVVGRKLRRGFVMYVNLNADDWREARLDVDLRNTLIALREDVERFQDQLLSGRLGQRLMSILPDFLYGFEERREGLGHEPGSVAEAIDWLARVRSSIADARSTLSVRDSPTTAMHLLALRFLPLGLLLASAGHVLLLLICGARIAGVRKDFPVGRIYLRIALAELPGIAVAITILWRVEFGLDAAGWPVALLWLAPVVTLAWVFLAGAPWRDRGLLDRLAGTWVVAK